MSFLGPKNVIFQLFWLQKNVLNFQMNRAGHMDPSMAQHPMGVAQGPGVPMTPAAQTIYNDKLRALKPYCENLKMRAQQCRMENNHEAAGKLETMLGVLEGRRVVGLDYLINLETWIYKKAEYLVSFFWVLWGESKKTIWRNTVIWMEK